MVKILIILCSFIILFTQLNRKSELDNISFKTSKDAMIDSLKVATELLDKMDFGNGASCSVSDGKMRYTRKDKGLGLFEITNNNSPSFPTIEPLNKNNSNRLFRLMLFLNRNDIHHMSKGRDGSYNFFYKQKKLNSHDDYSNYRAILYMKSLKDTSSIFTNSMVVLDRYKNLILIAPKRYNEPKLPMDRESIMKRRDELIRRIWEHKNNKK